MSNCRNEHDPGAGDESHSQPCSSPDVEQSLHGREFKCNNVDQAQHAVDLAFSYRGDVTVERRSSVTPIEGFVFDRRVGLGNDRDCIRMIAKASQDRVTIPLSDIALIHFTGRDTAEGKSFETWVKKYARDKLGVGEE